MWERIKEDLQALIVAIYFAILQGRDNRLEGRFGREYYIISSRNRGLNINGKALTPEMSMRGVLIQGETGSSKTAGSLIKGAMTVDGCQFIHAPSSEVFDKTSGANAERGHNIKVLWLTNVMKSLCFNPLLRCDTLAQITRLAYLLVSLFSSNRERKSFWSSKAIELLVCIFLILKKLEPRYQTLPNACFLLDNLAGESTREYIDRLFADKADEWLFTKYISICSQSDNTFSGVISTAQTALQIFDLDDDIRRLVSADTIGDFHQLRKEPTSFYLISSTTKIDYYAPIITLFLDQYFEAFFSRLPEEEDDLDVYFHLDEAPVLRFEGLDTICANIRKYRGSMCLLAQDASAQFARVHGEQARDSILSNLKTKVYYSVSYNEAIRLERELGAFEYKDYFDGFTVKKRSLKTVDELMQIPENKVLITQTGKRPVLTRFVPYYKDSKYRKLSELPPYEIKDQILPEIELVPLKTMYPKE